MRRHILFVMGAVGLPAATAHAHIQLDYPAQRYAEQKAGPCGRSPDTGRANVTVLPPGATITIRWRETINHPGHFRISFDDDGQDDFVDPAAYDDYNSAPSVIADNIPDTPAGGESTYQITLPNIECDNCTLQVVQVMTDKQPYGDGNDLYYQCADLVLAADAPDAGPQPDAGPEPDAGVTPPDDDDDGCNAGPGSLPGAGSLLLLAVIALALGRRRSA